MDQGVPEHTRSFSITYFCNFAYHLKRLLLGRGQFTRKYSATFFHQTDVNKTYWRKQFSIGSCGNSGVKRKPELLTKIGWFCINQCITRDYWIDGNFFKNCGSYRPLKILCIQIQLIDGLKLLIKYQNRRKQGQNTFLSRQIQFQLVRCIVNKQLH